MKSILSALIIVLVYICPAWGGDNNSYSNSSSLNIPSYSYTPNYNTTSAVTSNTLAVTSAVNAAMQTQQRMQSMQNAWNNTFNGMNRIGNKQSFVPSTTTMNMPALAPGMNRQLVPSLSQLSTYQQVPSLNSQGSLKDNHSPTGVQGNSAFISTPGSIAIPSSYFIESNK